MKVFIVNEIGYEYNDEYHSQPNISGSVGTPVKAFKDKKNAQDECKRLNEKHFLENPLQDYESTITDYYEVVEVEVADDDVESYASIREQMNKLEEKTKKLAQKEFKSGTTKLFKQLPQLESFSFTQYTDYFNDGDACHFHVHSDYPDINGENSEEELGADDGREWDNKARKYVQVREPNDASKMLQAVRDFLNQFEDRHFLAMFGDHVKVTVHRDGKVDVDDYSSHD